MKHRHLILLLASVPGAGAAWSQTPAPDAPKPAQSSPQTEAGEPRANTSAQAEAGEPRAQTSAPAPAGAPAASNAKSPGSKPAPAAVTPRPATPAQKAANDRLQLGTATVTGDREQPKVMYIVPWKRSDIGDLEGKPMNSLVDEILSPVDRDVFKREVRYYQTVNSDASQNGAKPPPGQVEK